MVRNILRNNLRKMIGRWSRWSVLHAEVSAEDIGEDKAEDLVEAQSGRQQLFSHRNNNC